MTIRVFRSLNEMIQHVSSQQQINYKEKIKKLSIRVTISTAGLVYTNTHIL
jgi:hypothetical protein